MVQSTPVTKVEVRFGVQKSDFAFRKHRPRATAHVGERTGAGHPGFPRCVFDSWHAEFFACDIEKGTCPSTPKL